MSVMMSSGSKEISSLPSVEEINGILGWSDRNTPILVPILNLRKGNRPSLDAKSGPFPGPRIYPRLLYQGPSGTRPLKPLSTYLLGNRTRLQLRSQSQLQLCSLMILHYEKYKHGVSPTWKRKTSSFFWVLPLTPTPRSDQIQEPLIPPPLTSQSGRKRGILRLEHILVVSLWFIILLISVHVPNILIVILWLRLRVRLRFRCCLIYWLFRQLEAFRSPRGQSWRLLIILRKDNVEQGDLHSAGAASPKPPNGGLLRPHHNHPTSSTLHPAYI